MREKEKREYNKSTDDELELQPARKEHKKLKIKNPSLNFWGKKKKRRIPILILFEPFK